MPWVADPYEWIDPEVGRQGGTISLPEIERTHQRLRNSVKPTDQRALHQQARDSIVAYAKLHGFEATRHIIVKATGVTALQFVPENKYVDLIEALR